MLMLLQVIKSTFLPISTKLGNNWIHMDCQIFLVKGQMIDVLTLVDDTVSVPGLISALVLQKQE